MGRFQDSTETVDLPRGRRLGWRNCLRKGCERRYQARQWNQQYCQDPECQREVRRWHARKRQERHRASPEARRKHAEAERVRREEARLRRASASESDVSAAVSASPAWSRSNGPYPERVCDRPGCYEAPRDSRRVASSYCSDECRRAVRRVKDRQRKWLARKTKAGRLKRRLEYHAAAKKRLPLPPRADQDRGRRCSSVAAGPPEIAVGDYGRSEESPLSWEHFPGVGRHDSEADSRSRPRAPPAE